MNDEDIKEILEIILESLSGKDVHWRLEGSANLRVQGVEVSVRDLDIVTNDDGIKVFRKALKQFIVKDFFSQKVNGPSLVLDINNFEVEINSYGDTELRMLDKIEVILWNGLQIPVLPLDCAKRFYELIERSEKIDVICKHLSA